jgi:signal peptidase I
MVFQYQYQYQYQYQLQRGLGLTTYESFSHLLHDTYSNPVLLSLLVALVPLLYFFLRDRIARTQAFQTLNRLYEKRKREKELKRARIAFEETFLKKKRADLSTILLVGFTLLIGGLIFTQSMFFVAVTSNSMAPTFWESDLVLVQSITRDYQKGDVIVFRNPNVKFDDKIIHRINSISLDGKDLETKGDNVNFPDDWTLSSDQILGSAVTYNERPVVAKKIGRYFIKDYGLDKGVSYENDPIVQFLRKSASNVHSYGPMYLVVILLLIFLTMLQKPEKGKVY